MFYFKGFLFFLLGVFFLFGGMLTTSMLPQIKFVKIIDLFLIFLSLLFFFYGIKCCYLLIKTPDVSVFIKIFNTFTFLLNLGSLIILLLSSFAVLVLGE